MQKNKGSIALILILAIAAALLGGGGTYVALKTFDDIKGAESPTYQDEEIPADGNDQEPKSPEASSKKIYINEELGFSFEYADTFTLTERDASGYTILQLVKDALPELDIVWELETSLFTPDGKFTMAIGKPDTLEFGGRTCALEGPTSVDGHGVAIQVCESGDTPPTIKAFIQLRKNGAGSVQLYGTENYQLVLDIVNSFRFKDTNSEEWLLRVGGQEGDSTVSGSAPESSTPKSDSKKFTTACGAYSPAEISYTALAGGNVAAKDLAIAECFYRSVKECTKGSMVLNYNNGRSTFMEVVGKSANGCVYQAYDHGGNQKNIRCTISFDVLQTMLPLEMLKAANPDEIIASIVGAASFTAYETPGFLVGTDDKSTCVDY